MTHSNPDPPTRRDWLTQCTRGTILAGLAAMGYHILGRDPNTDCRRPTKVCRSCGLLAYCDADRARNEKHPM